jgi:hypothetical protein
MYWANTNRDDAFPSGQVGGDDLVAGQGSPISRSSFFHWPPRPRQ